jgi:hypothetical protein
LDTANLDEASLHFRRGEDEFTARRARTALDAFNLAEKAGHDPDECAAYRWQCRMLLGDFEGAWIESDAIAARNREDPNALWDGQPLDNTRLVIRCLHGYGDAIQFLRYAELLRPRVRQIIVETHPEMVSLVRWMPFVDRVATWDGGQAPKSLEWDRQIEVTELPRAFRTTVDTVPARIPYIDVPEGARAASRRNLGVGGPKIGLLWASSSWNPDRCMSLNQLLPAIEGVSARFFSFQRGTARDEMYRVAAGPPIHDTSLHSPEIADTAADLTHMDLLITVDTMAAHLAGALGVRVWTLLPFEADWRWMVGREDTPWYPSMRLFRQERAGDWGPVVRRVNAELMRRRFDR